MKNNMNLKKQIILICYVVLFVSCGLSVSGCGYRLAGNGTLPTGVNSICVSIFENRSTETGMENQLASDMIYEFTRSGRKVVSDPALADSILTGIVKSVSVETLSYRSNQTSIESRVRVVVDAKLKNKKGEEIWTADGISEDQAYVADSDNQVNGKNKKDALAKLSLRLAENLHHRMTEGF